MPDDTDEIVGSIGRELVSRLAPEELPLYPSLVKQLQGATKRGRGGRASSDDQLLGFGAAEAMAMLTPVILSFTGSFWKALVAETAQDSAHGVVEYLRARLPGRQEAAAAALTPGQLQLVRTVAEREASRLDVSESQAGLLADAMVGVLTASPV